MRTLEQIAMERINARQRVEGIGMMQAFGIGAEELARREIAYARAQAEYRRLDEEWRTRLQQEISAGTCP